MVVSHSGAFSYKYNTAKRGGCSSFFFIKVLELGKALKKNLGNQDRRYITRPKLMTIKLTSTFILTLMKVTFAVQHGIFVVAS